jgi:hypothetical protein
VLYLKFIDDMEFINDYTDKFLKSYLMFVKSSTFVKLGYVVFENEKT